MRLKSCLVRVPEVFIKDCVVTPTNRALRFQKLNAIYITTEATYERLVLVPGPRGLTHFVTMPLAPTPPLLSMQ